MLVKLNLGCGEKKLPGFLNVDFNPDIKPDKKVNLTKLPWPFKTSSCDEVYCSHFLEHMEYPINIIEEIYRILKTKGKLTIISPYFSSVGAYYNLEHKNFWAWRTTDYFGTSLYKYSHKANFKIKGKQLVFPKIYKLIGIQRLANLFPEIYEDFFAFIFPAREIHYELIAYK